MKREDDNSWPEAMVDALERLSAGSPHIEVEWGADSVDLSASVDSLLDVLKLEWPAVAFAAGLVSMVAAAAFWNPGDTSGGGGVSIILLVTAGLLGLFLCGVFLFLFWILTTNRYDVGFSRNKVVIEHVTAAVTKKFEIQTGDSVVLGRSALDMSRCKLSANDESTILNPPWNKERAEDLLRAISACVDA